MGKIGFGIIGSGGIATTAHIPSLLEITDAQLLAIASRSIEKARAAAAHVDGAAAYADNQQVIDHPGVEAVILCMPPKWHAEWAIKAAQAGKHVLCEKPMACSLAECDAMIAACKAAGVQLMVAEMKRFNPGFRKAKELLDQGVIGDIFLARYHNSYFEPHTREGWWTDAAISGGGEMMNELTHQVNVLRWLLGPVTEVGCMSNHPQGPMPEDNAVVSLRFQSNAISVVTISWMTKSYNVAFPPPWSTPGTNASTSSEQRARYVSRHPLPTGARQSSYWCTRKRTYPASAGGGTWCVVRLPRTMSNNCSISSAASRGMTRVRSRVRKAAPIWPWCSPLCRLLKGGVARSHSAASWTWSLVSFAVPILYPAGDPAHT